MEIVVSQRERDGIVRTLRPIRSDVAALRRYLVDHGLLDRSDGLYRRCGGPVLLERSG